MDGMDVHNQVLVGDIWRYEQHFYWIETWIKNWDLPLSDETCGTWGPQAKRAPCATSSGLLGSIWFSWPRNTRWSEVPYLSYLGMSHLVSELPHALPHFTNFRVNKNGITWWWEWRFWILSPGWGFHILKQPHLVLTTRGLLKSIKTSTPRNQTWLAGKFLLNGHLNGKITYKYTVNIHCHAWLPEGALKT